MKELTPAGLADQIARWDWRDTFRVGNKNAIVEMFEAYGEQVRASCQTIDVATSDHLAKEVSEMSDEEFDVICQRLMDDNNNKQQENGNS